MFRLHRRTNRRSAHAFTVARSFQARWMMIPCGDFVAVSTGIADPSKPDICPST